MPVRQETVKSERLSGALARALSEEDVPGFFDQLDRVTGLPGPRPNFDVIRALALEIAGAGGAGEALTESLLAEKRISRYAVGVFVVAARASKARDRIHLKAMSDLSDAGEKERRDVVIEALAWVLAKRVDEGATILRQYSDGYLHAHVALEAMTRETVLNAMRDEGALVGLLGDAFEMSDVSNRAAERSQGLRQLREGLPQEILRALGRFSSVQAFIVERFPIERPESREILARVISGCRPLLGEAESGRLRAEFESFEKTPRYAARIVAGTRKRSRGR